MKFSAKPVKQISHLGTKGIFRPCDELTPMILGMFPQDFDHIEFWAVRRQIEKGGVVLDVPALRDFVINAVMDSGIIENDENWFGRSDVGEKFVTKVSRVTGLVACR